ncbi:Dbl-like domain-containing protein [Calocera viscosa TUFC12733]|uniref:Dbl-like domain-containing protein n=1 Tax=Calocera viscosa (strain TUFC12733) TaxID=1330018 RepID=A0A167S434_CALVF|nr:Dbl-like domain-containing protein [Calocera viscosa TUFC12733]
MFEEEDDERFVNLALLSHVAVRLRDKVPRGTHVKGSIPYERAFTGKDIVSTLQSMIQHYLLSQMNVTTHDRSLGLMVARSLYEQVFFYEVEWGTNPISDSVEDVFMFLDDFEGGSAAPMGEREELPTAVVTPFTRCYSPTCGDGGPCYAYGCPRRNFMGQEADADTSPQVGTREQWRDNIGREFLHTLPESEIKRQDIILKIIKKEEMFNDDLDVLESVFLKPLRAARPPIMSHDYLEDFIGDVFGNFLDLRECSRRLLEILKVRQREQNPVIQKIGDIFLNSAVDFRQVYPTYVGHLPVAEKRLKDEMERNHELRLFLEQCSRSPAARRMDLKFFISRPSEHLQRYPVVLQALLQETLVGSPDGDYLFEALQAIRRLHSVAQLMTFQSAMLRGPTSKLEWHDLLPEGALQDIERHEVKRQSQIFELIKGEMEYVKDLETIETLFVRRLRAEPVIPPDRRTEFIHDAFWNFQELYRHHRKMLDKLQEIQREEYPLIYSITEPVLEAALNWRDAYMEYVPHYPIAEYKIDRELATNQAFKDFFDSCVKHPDARRQDMKAFVNRPIPRLLRYSLLLQAIYDSSPADHPDRETIPGVLDILKSLSKATNAGVAVSETKVKLWKYSHDLVWKEGGEAVDLQLQDETRSLIHSGKLLRQPETGFEWNGWSELFVLLFDNYRDFSDGVAVVMTKPKETKDGIKYVVRGRPIPLELLALTNFTEIPQQRSVGLLRSRLRGDRGEVITTSLNGAGVAQQESNDPRFVYPFTIYNSARESGFYTLYAETQQARAEWKAKLEEALGLRVAVQENNKVLEIETLSDDTFYVPLQASTQQASWNEENAFTGKVTCSVPFSTPDGRGLIAVGCAEGVWIGLRHDSRSLRRVLALKQVTQCAMLEKFGIFLVLADKSLFAYLLEALVPTSTTTSNTARQPERLNKDVVFFSVGTLGDRTLITYMKKKGMDSVFQVVEPVLEKIQEKSKPVGAFGRFMSGAKSEWFRSYREFFLPSEAYDVYFLRLKIVILCQKGFEIMGLADFKSDTIPHANDQRWGGIAKRFETCKPIGIYRTSSEEFLLCYDEFGIYVGRHGDPSRGEQGVVEWEGKPLKAAFHAPYVLLFDKRFIEIRHIDKLHLVQIIPGTDISLIYDGRASDMTPQIDPGPEGYSDGSTPQDARIHAVMKMPQNPNPHHRGTAQHVFELVPTIPLFLPDTLASPSTSVYNFQNSPPHSPQLQASSLQSWGRY